MLAALQQGFGADIPDVRNQLAAGKTSLEGFSPSQGLW